MFRKFAAVLVVSSVSFGITGCGGSATTTLQGVSVELPPSKEIKRDSQNRFETREFKVTINSGKLTINGTSYGTVQKGDQVKVSADASVTVNGSTRTGS